MPEKISEQREIKETKFMTGPLTANDLITPVKLLFNQEEQAEIEGADHKELVKISKMFEADPNVADQINVNLVRFKDLNADLFGVQELINDHLDLKSHLPKELPKDKEELNKIIRATRQKIMEKLSAEDKEELNELLEVKNELVAELKEHLKVLKGIGAEPEYKENFKKYLTLNLAVINAYNEEVEPLKKEIVAEKKNLYKKQIQRARLAKGDLNKRRTLDNMVKKSQDKVNELEKELDNWIGGAGEEKKGAKKEEQPGGFRELYNVDRVKYVTKLSEQLKEGKFIETKGTEETVGFAMESLRLAQPALLVGDLGSGKSECLKHCIKRFLIEKGRLKESDYKNEEVFVFSGSKEASIYDLMGKLKIRHKNLNLKDRWETFKKDMAQINQEDKLGLDLSNMDTIEQIKLAAQVYESGITETDFARGALVRAIEEDKPIIIDEIDQIPPEILARLNDILTKGPGERVRIQENGEEEIKIGENFIIMGTANLKSGKYKSREELDIAFKSRFLPREYDYLNAEDIYDLILAYFLHEETGTLDPNLSAEDFIRFPRLVMAMKETQEIFQGKYKTKAFSKANTGGGGSNIELNSTVFSTRSLIQILKRWKESGNLAPGSLDKSLGEVLLGQAVTNKEEQLYLTEILLRFGFFKDWKAEDFNKKLGVMIEPSTLKAIQGLITSDFKPEDDKFLKEAMDAAPAMLSFARQHGFKIEEVKEALTRQAA